MFQGLRTVIYLIKPEKLDDAKKWYTKLFKKAPYFDQPFYVGFNVGGFEFGLHPTEDKITLGTNVQAYWGVSNIESALKDCLALEASVNSEIQNVGDDIKVATIQDPFGNILGLIENPNFKIEN